MGLTSVLLSQLHSLAGPAITLVYPLYASVMAIESGGKENDEQWLAYWIIYSLLTLMEMVAKSFFYWFPFWYQIKVVFVAWLVLPQFMGASFLYEKFVREQLKKIGQQAQAQEQEGGGGGGGGGGGEEGGEGN